MVSFKLINQESYKIYEYMAYQVCFETDNPLKIMCVHSRLNSAKPANK